MLHREIIVPCAGIHNNQRNTIWQQTVELFIVKVSDSSSNHWFLTIKKCISVACLTFKSLEVTLCITVFKIKKFCMLITLQLCVFVRISEQTATFALYCTNWLVFITVVESVYSAVRIDCLYNTDTIRL